MNRLRRAAMMAAIMAAGFTFLVPRPALSGEQYDYREVTWCPSGLCYEVRCLACPYQPPVGCEECQITEPNLCNTEDCREPML
jgi:hypothetical protein